MIEGRIKVYDEAEFKTTSSTMTYYDTDGYEDETMFPFRSHWTRPSQNQVKYIPIEKKITRLMTLLEEELPKTGIQIGSKVKRIQSTTIGTVIDISLDPIKTYCEIDDSFEPIIVQLETGTVMHYAINELELIDDPTDTTTNHQ